jgi:hypothetical protein
MKPRVSTLGWLKLSGKNVLSVSATVICRYQYIELCVYVCECESIHGSDHVVQISVLKYSVLYH